MPQTKKGQTPKGAKGTNSVMSKVKAVIKAVQVKATQATTTKPAPKASKTAKPAKMAKPTATTKPTVAAKKPIKTGAAKTVAKMEEPQKVLDKSKVALKKETATREAATSEAIPAEKPAKAPKAPKVPRISAAALARAEKATDAANQLSAKWSSLYKKAESIEAKPYNMKAVYEEKTAIVHKLLGWGYILANKNDRLEVLFKDGIKYLISNYKPS